jgi:hypothetical protein
VFKNNIKKMEDKIMKDIKVCYGIDVDCVAGWLDHMEEKIHRVTSQEVYLPAE